MARRSILIVAPHPDDETLGCGGVFAGRAAEGCDVAVLVVTDGRHLFRLSRWKIETDPTPDETAAMRKDETRRAVDVLGGRSETIRFLDVEDGTLSRHAEAVSETMAEIIDEVEPDEIYVTSEHEEHTDHVAACAVVRAAMAKTHSGATLHRYVIALADGVSPGSVDEPTVAVDIAAHMETKRRAVRRFASHLTIVAQGQTEPFFPDADAWVGPTETFFAPPRRNL
ncbi:MAG: PIG-L deacetylase family protein [Planctomycetota bacterium]